MIDSVIQIKDLVKKYRTMEKPAVNKISFDIPKGQIFGLMGLNGAGKTTTVKVLLGLIKKTAGTVLIKNRDIKDYRIRKIIGYLPEVHSFPGYLKGREAIEIFSSMSNFSRKEINSRIPDYFEKVSLKEDMNRFISEYSKGMKQKLALINAIIHEPELLILDEPSSGLDPGARKNLRALLKELKEQGVTIMLNSHQLLEIESICDRIGIIHNGNINEFGDVKTISEKYLTENQIYDVETAKLKDSIFKEIKEKFNEVVESGGGFKVRLADDNEIDKLIDFLRSQNVTLRGFSREGGSLENAFIEITKKNGKE